MSSKGRSEAYAVLGKSFCSSLLKLWIPSKMPSRSCCFSCTWYIYSALHMLMNTLQSRAIPTLVLFLHSDCIYINFKITRWREGEGFFSPRSQPTNMAYFTLGLVFTSRAGMLGSTAFYSGTMSQDSSWAVQAAAPASSQQCLQALADTGAWNSSWGHR